MSTHLPLAGRRVAILIATGYHDHEFWFPYYRFREEGAEVVVAGPQLGRVLGEGRHGSDGLPAHITSTALQIAHEKFDCIYLPGGMIGPMNLRAHGPVLELVRRAMEDGTIVAAICHGPWILVSAGVVKGRKISCPEDMAADVINAGGIHTVEPAVRDGNLITAYSFRFLPEHFRLIMPALRAAK